MYFESFGKMLYYIAVALCFADLFYSVSEINWCENSKMNKVTTHKIRIFSTFLYPQCILYSNLVFNKPERVQPV